MSIPMRVGSWTTIALVSMAIGASSAYAEPLRPDITTWRSRDQLEYLRVNAVVQGLDDPPVSADKLKSLTEARLSALDVYGARREGGGTGIGEPIVLVSVLMAPDEPCVFSADLRVSEEAILRSHASTRDGPRWRANTWKGAVCYSNAYLLSASCAEKILTCVNGIVDQFISEFGGAGVQDTPGARR